MSLAGQMTKSFIKRNLKTISNALRWLSDFCIWGVLLNIVIAQEKKTQKGNKDIAQEKFPLCKGESMSTLRKEKSKKN